MPKIDKIQGKKWLEYDKIQGKMAFYRTKFRQVIRLSGRFRFTVVGTVPQVPCAPKIATLCIRTSLLLFNC